MKDNMDEYINSLYRAETADDLGDALDHLIGLLLDYDIDEWPAALEQMMDSMRDHVDSSVKHTLNNGYVCCSPSLATLRFLVAEIQHSASINPRWAIAKLEYYRDMIVSCDNMTVLRSYRVANSVLEYLETHFKVFSTSAEQCVLSIPYCSIGCVAQGIIGPDRREMFVNASDNIDQVISMTIDLASQAVANDDLPSEGINLLKATSVPNIMQMSKDDQITAYTDAIATGLAYGSSYTKVISYDSQWGLEWNKYVKAVIRDRTILRDM